MPHIQNHSDISKIQTVIFDCDGVIWVESELIKGAKELYAYLMNSGRNVIFVTNNSTKTVDEYVKKFENLEFLGSCDFQKTGF